MWWINIIFDTLFFLILCVFFYLQIKDWWFMRTHELLQNPETKQWEWVKK